jgi:hypothetical protein
MSKIYIVEFDKTAIDARGQNVMSAHYPAAVKQAAITITGSSTQSAAFGGTTRFIQFHTDAICSIDVGPNPTADPAYDRMAANETRYIGVEPGHKLAVITNT